MLAMITTAPHVLAEKHPIAASRVNTHPEACIPKAAFMRGIAKTTFASTVVVWVSAITRRPRPRARKRAGS